MAGDRIGAKAEDRDEDRSAEEGHNKDALRKMDGDHEEDRSWVRTKIKRVRWYLSPWL